MAINWDTLERDFSGLTDGQNIGKYSGDTDIQDPITPANKRFTTWGEKGRGDLAGYGTEGDTGITRGGLRDSSARLAIAQGWDGLGLEFAPWTDPVTRPTSGQFGGKLTFDTPLVKGQTMHAGVWMYVPADFDFRAEPGFLKTLRFTRSENSTQLMEVQVSAAAGDGALTGWNLQDEAMQPAGGGERDTSRVLIKGQWNFIAFSAYLSDVPSELRKRLWVNDELVYEQIGETNGTLTARWYDNGWQTDNNASPNFATLNSATDTVTRLYLFTYWNGGTPTEYDGSRGPWPSVRGTEPYQDQALNIDSVVVHTNEADLGTDASGNKYIASTDVFPTNIVNDNFESYSLGSSPTGTTDSATWLSSGSRIEISNTVANGGTKSLRFRYGPDPSGSDSTAEQAITLDGSGYMELWLEWDMYTPTNFTHRDEGNNKIIYLHNDYGEENGGIEYWPDRTPAALGQPANGKSYPTHVYRTSSATAFGHYPQPNFGNIVFDPAEAGTWSRFKLHYKKSDAGSSNASVQFYKNDVLLINRDNFDDYNPSRGLKPITGMKLMGWSNSGYLDETDFYMDNLYISNVGFLEDVAPWSAAVDAAGTTVTVTLDEAYTTSGADYTKFTIAGHTISASSLPLVSGTSFTLTVDEITEDESPVLVYDASGNTFVADSDSSVIPAGTIGVTNGSTVDVTAPVLSSTTSVTTGTTTATGTVDTDEDSGFLWYTVTTGPTDTSGNILGGTSQEVSGTGTQIVSATSLTASTGYYFHFIHVDAASNVSNKVDSPLFTTFSSTAPTLETGIGNPNIPVFSASGSVLTLTFSEAVTTSVATGLTLSAGEALTYSSGSTTDTIVYDVFPYAQAGGEILNFTGGADLIESTASGADVEAFSDVAVNGSSVSSPPVLVGTPSVNVTGTLLTFSFNEAVDNLPSPIHSAFTLTGSGILSNAFVSSTLVGGNASFVISPAVEVGETLTLDFVQAGGEFTGPTTGIGVESFSSQPVNNSTVDTLPPVFTSSPVVIKTTLTGHSIRQTIDKAGTVYGVRTVTGALDNEGFSVPPPSSEQVKNGQDGNGAVAPESTSVAATAGNPCVLTFSGGAKNTSYDYYIVAEDNVPNLQVEAVKVTATTENLLFNGSGGGGLPAAGPKKKVKMKWEESKRKGKK